MLLEVLLEQETASLSRSRCSTASQSRNGRSLQIARLRLLPMPSPASPQATPIRCSAHPSNAGIGASTFEALVHALAINLIMVEDPAKLAEMWQHYEASSESRVRANHAIGDRVLTRAMTKLGKLRMAKLTSLDQA
jgi:hypothetical protein